MEEKDIEDKVVEGRCVGVGVAAMGEGLAVGGSGRHLQVVTGERKKIKWISDL